MNTFSGAESIELTTDEIQLLRFTCDLIVEDEAAFGPLHGRPAPKVLQKSAETLVSRGLADKKTYRPHRELVRRLLIAAQPDARIILLEAGPGTGERLLDVYVRAGAFVHHSRNGDVHRIGPPLEYVDVFDEVLSHFTARVTSGDFIDLHLTPAEYYAFSTAAVELAHQKAQGQRNVRLESALPAKVAGDSSMDGAVLMPGQRNRFVPGPDAVSLLAVPDEIGWKAALHGLLDKGAIARNGSTYLMRGYLHDLALGLANRTRHVLTRFDFGGEDWFVRDATLVPVPGSLFWLRTTHDGGLRIRELDRDTLKTAVRSAIEDIHPGKTASY